MLWNIHHIRLPDWAGQLAGILPLSALIEFIDIGTKLHIAQLTGSVSRWQWPVTPAGARLLLATSDSESECILDHPERSAMLECFDTRHGDAYPSSTPTTTRLWCAASWPRVILDNTQLDKQNPGVRPQVLELFQIEAERTMASKTAMESPSVARSTPSVFKRWCHSIKPDKHSTCGWTCWILLLLLSILSHMWLALCYLLLIAATGFVISNTHGRKPRSPLNSDQHGKYNRLIVSASSRNSSEWTAFYGESVMLNGLLNRPLRRPGAPFRPGGSVLLLQVLILGQWLTVVAVSSLTGWDAYVVSVWIFFCAAFSAYLQTPSKAAQTWIQRNCQVRVRVVKAEFSSRRAMLGALVYLNPDTAGSAGACTSWMNPILSNSSLDRGEWESALLQAVQSENKPSPQQPNPPAHWDKWIAEGVDVGKRMKLELQKGW